MAVLAIRPRPVDKGRDSVKTFAFRCKWVEIEHGIERPDGYSYATSRKDLDKVISLRRLNNESSCYSTVSDIKVVPVDIRLYNEIQKLPNHCFTTNNNKHPQDYEVDHSN